MKRISALLLTAIALCSCGNSNTQKEQVAEKAVMTVKHEICKVPFTYPASLKGKQDISILPQVSGILTQVLVQEGQFVKKDQVMFRIDDTSYSAAVDHAEASVEMASADVETAKIELDATKQLYDKGVISDHQFKVYTNKLMVAKANLAEANAALKNARNDYNHTFVRAPHDGYVGNIPYRQGTLVGPSIREPLTVVSDNSVIYAYISANADNYLDLAHNYGGRDEMLKALPDMELILGDNVVYGFKGRVETVSGIIDEQTGALSIRVAFPNDNGILSAGGSGTVRMYIDYEGISIPRSATFELQDKHFVYRCIKNDDGSYSAKSTMVKLYRVDETRYIVTEGLKEGDAIVLDGVRKMSDNMKISPKK